MLKLSPGVASKNRCSQRSACVFETSCSGRALIEPLCHPTLQEGCLTTSPHTDYRQSLRRNAGQPDVARRQRWNRCSQRFASFVLSRSPDIVLSIKGAASTFILYRRSNTALFVRAKRTKVFVLFTSAVQTSRRGAVAVRGPSPYPCITSPATKRICGCGSAMHWLESGGCPDCRGHGEGRERVEYDVDDDPQPHAPRVPDRVDHRQHHDEAAGAFPR